MNSLLLLFLVFLKIGAVSFGGGYGMISLLREEVLANGWLTEEEFLNFIAVSESTPGPVAVNMATFIGSSQAGFLGALLATLGVVLPSFFILLAFAALLSNVMKKEGTQAVLGGIRPVVTGLILSTAIVMIASQTLSYAHIHDEISVDWRTIVIFALVALLAFVVKKYKKKKISPVLLILFSALLGVGLYGLPL